MKIQIKKFLNQFINWLYFILSVAIIGWISVYASSQFPSKVNPWDQLTSTNFNNMVDYLVPAWAIIPFNSTTCPNWWIAADWQNWTIDLRWEFIRGWDNWRWVDSWRNIWTAQLDQMQRITGSVWVRAWNSYWSPAWAFSSSSTSWDRPDGTLSWWAFNPMRFDSWNSPWARVSDTTDWETRPRNVALLFCIKQ